MATGHIVTNLDDTVTIDNLLNTAQFEEVIVDETGGIPLGKCCYLTGSSGGIPTIALASISNPNHVPAYGVSVEAKSDGQSIRIVKRGTIAFDTTLMVKTPAIDDVLYLGENGDLESEPTGGINGNLQVARVTRTGSNGLITMELSSFQLSAEFNGVLRSIIENTSDGISAGTAMTAKNDTGDYASLGMTGSSNQFGVKTAVIFNSGGGQTRNLINGNFGWSWRNDTGLGQTDKAELSADGKLTARGTMKFDGDVTEDGGIWTNLTDEEVQVQFGGTAFTIPSSAYERCLLRKNANQSLAKDVWTDLTFEVDTVDVGDMHDTVTNNEIVTIQKSGFFLVIIGVEFAANASGIRSARLEINGTPSASMFENDAFGGGEPTLLSASVGREFIIGDEISLQAKQSGPANLNVLINSTFFNVIRLY